MKCVELARNNVADQHKSDATYHKRKFVCGQSHDFRDVARDAHRALLCGVAACVTFTWTTEAPAQGGLGVLNVLCSGDSAAVTVANPSGARWLGVTAELENGDYYDFPAERLGTLSAGTSKRYSVPSRYNPVRYMAALWGGRENANEPWSDRVMNFQGYNMTNKRSETASCRN
jgi:hypothetical protein